MINAKRETNPSHRSLTQSQIGKSKKLVPVNLDTMDPQELQQLKDCFSLFDENNTGHIDPAEIKKALQSLGLDQRNLIVSLMLDDLQEPGTQIDFVTFVTIITQRLGDTKTQEGVRKLFNLYDVDEKGEIDFEKIKRIAKELGETMNDQQIADMMHHVHVLNRTEENGQLTFEEFYAIVTQQN